MQAIYVEVSDEITTVIERMKKSEDTSVALVVPKGAIIVQSVVNLKLAKKAASDSNKQLILITTDQIGTNLASQVGIPTKTHLEAAETSIPNQDSAVVGGVKVHRYYDEKEEITPDEEVNKPNPIIPRELLQDSEPSPLPKSGEETVDHAAQLSTITVRPLAIEVPLKKEWPHTPSNPLSSEPLLQQTPPPSDPPKKKRKLWLLPVYLLILIMLVGIGFGAYYFPKTTVIISPKVTSFNQVVTLLASTGASIDASGNTLTIPTDELSTGATTTVTVTATGTKEVGETAKGTALILNGYSSSPQTLASGAIIQAKGLSFTTTADILVPGAQVQAGKPVPGSASVAITANQPGTNSNLSNVAGSVTASGTNLYSQVVTTSGGTSKQVSVVNATDLANARAALIKKLQDQTANQLNEQIKNSSPFFDKNNDSFTLDDFSSSVPAGSEASSVDATGKATLKRITVAQLAVESVVQQYMQKEQSKNHAITISSLTSKQFKLDTASKSVTLTVEAKGIIGTLIPLGTLRSQLIGKKKATGLDIIRQNTDNASVEIKQTPSWWPIHNFPYSEKYLDLEIHD